MKYCPDCSAECHDEDKFCPECKFPLQLRISEEGRRFSTPPHLYRQWLRVIQLLRKTGIHIDNSPERGLTNSQAWIIFPGVGLIFLLFSVLFSQSMAEWLIPVDSNPISIDFNQNQASGSGTPTTHDETPISVLKEALETSEDQNQPPEWNQPLTYRKPVAPDLILKWAENAVVEIEIGGKYGFGTAFLDGRYILTTYDMVEQAFERVRGTIQGDKSFIQGTQVIEPDVLFKGKHLKQVQLIRRLENPPLGILKVDGISPPKFKPNFQDKILPDTEVLALIELGGIKELEPVKVGQPFVVEEIEVLSLETAGSGRSEGLPVFNTYGELIGVQLVLDGQKGFIPLVDMREKAPYVYRDIHNVIQGTASAL